MQTEKTCNMIDLTELRRRQGLTQRDSLVRQTREECWETEEASGFRPVVLVPIPDARRRARRERIAWGMEIGACLSLVLMAAAFALRVLL